MVVEEMCGSKFGNRCCFFFGGRILRFFHTCFALHPFARHKFRAGFICGAEGRDGHSSATSSNRKHYRLDSQRFVGNTIPHQTKQRKSTKLYIVSIVIHQSTLKYSHDFTPFFRWIWISDDSLQEMRWNVRRFQRWQVRHVGNFVAVDGFGWWQFAGHLERAEAPSQATENWPSDMWNSVKSLVFFFFLKCSFSSCFRACGIGFPLLLAVSQPPLPGPVSVKPNPGVTPSHPMASTARFNSEEGFPVRKTQWCFCGNLQSRKFGKKKVDTWCCLTWTLRHLLMLKFLPRDLVGD